VLFYREIMEEQHRQPAVQLSPRLLVSVITVVWLAAAFGKFMAFRAWQMLLPLVRDSSHVNLTQISWYVALFHVGIFLLAAIGAMVLFWIALLAFQSPGLSQFFMPAPICPNPFPSAISSGQNWVARTAVKSRPVIIILLIILVWLFAVITKYIDAEWREVSENWDGHHPVPIQLWWCGVFAQSAMCFYLCRNRGKRTTLALASMLLFWVFFVAYIPYAVFHKPIEDVGGPATPKPDYRLISSSPASL
jgi:hypothetical protein